MRPIFVSAMTAPTLPADKKLRTKTLCWTALLAVLGVIGFWLLVVYLDALTALRTTDPQLVAEKYSRLLFICGLATVLIACGAGGALGFMFHRALKAKQFPPPGIRLMWDTQLRTGKEARRIALTGLAVAVAIILGGVGFGMAMVKIACTRIPSGPFFEASGVEELLPPTRLQSVNLAVSEQPRAAERTRQDLPCRALRNALIQWRQFDFIENYQILERGPLYDFVEAEATVVSGTGDDRAGRVSLFSSHMLYRHSSYSCGDPGATRVTRPTSYST